MNQNRTFIGQIESTTRRDLYFFALYRALEAGLLTGMVLSPATGVFGDLDSSPAASIVGLAYLAVAVALLLLSKQWQWMQVLVTLGLLADIGAAAAITWLMPEAGSGIGMLLLFNVAIAAVLLPFRLGMALAAVAVAALLGAFVLNLVGARDAGRPLTELMMIPVTYIAVAYLAGRVGQRARQNQQLAAERGAEVASLVEVNELIIRRMRTGVLVVDGQFHIRLANEAAAALLGSEGSQQHDGHLMDIAPQLAQRLDLWRHGFHNSDETPLQLQPGQPEVQPRFARLLAGSDLSLVFLDDASVVSRRAESLTLAALGRFSASLAHEIRNPLTAINYAVQLLQESEHLDDTDRRLLSIIHLQCQRTNGIVENVLSLARRERANPEHLELGPFIQQFADEYRMTMPLETDQLETLPSTQKVIALVDPAHLHQVLSVLVQNAFKYGRRPGEPAHVSLRIANEGRNALLEVGDRGPGIPPAIAEKLFEAFYTTSEHGTGLGLYIARELCRANQATLDYRPGAEGGSCFRITLPGPHALLPDDGDARASKRPRDKIRTNGDTTGHA